MTLDLAVRDAGAADRVARRAFASLTHRLEVLRASADANGRLQILFFSNRPEYFASGGIDPNIDNADIVFASGSDVRTLIDYRFDLAIICNAVVDEHLVHFLLKASSNPPLIVSWTWDNHHSPWGNIKTVALADIILPGHDFARDVLYHAGIPIGAFMPLCTGQWPRRLAASLMAKASSLTRSNRLYGSYVDWGLGERAAIVRRLAADLPETELALIDPDDRGRYFGESAAARFEDWARHKTHLVLPLERDVSCRLFDSLLVGQIPIIPAQCPDLDRIFSPEDRASLPIVTTDDLSSAAVEAAWRKATYAFDEAGEDGVWRRHSTALERHHADVRIGQIIRYVLDLGTAGTFETSADAGGVRMIATLADDGDEERFRFAGLGA